MSSDSFWYRLGYALEQARGTPREGRRRLAGLKERRRPHTRASTPAAVAGADAWLASGAVALASKALDVWSPRRKAGVFGLVWAGAAGAGAALIVELVRPLLEGRLRSPTLGPDTPDRMLGGAGQGLLYATVVEPRLPGPALFKGLVYASAEYGAEALGGLGGLLGPHAPLHRVPVLSRALTGLPPRGRDYLEHVTFGIALALLYRSSPANNGIAEPLDG